MLEGIKNAFGEHLLSGPLINADETTLQVMGEKDRPNQSRSYM
ncbi:MAG: hypothetical protein DRP60_02320 [Spirochaetes bacterium]|nr:MAG: hypothetical protein DRP60_02320 [Spirochaetota bacterium]